VSARIAVVGGGIAGIYSAWLLDRRGFAVTLYEADTRLGGHTDTHGIATDAGELAVDSGFIVFNRANYPLFSAFLEELGVETQPSNMSFAVVDEARNLEYNAENLGTLFAQRRNLLRPAFWSMLRDLMRFYRQSPGLLESVDDELTLGEFLAREGFGKTFARDHLVPMTAALWSLPMVDAGRFPLGYLLRFMNNHAMLQLTGRPQWLTVTGGSQRYVEAVRRRWRVDVRAGLPVESVRRDAGGVTVTAGEGERYDTAVIACHSDQALPLLVDADEHERAVLGAIAYRPNEVLVHSDVSVLPRRRRARASWNVRLDSHGRARVSYYMNKLQSLPTNTPYIVSLNQAGRVDPASVIAARTYHHPVYTAATIAAQQRWAEINGVRRTWFCGAYWGWGFHEDGVRSARRVVDGISARAIRHAA